MKSYFYRAAQANGDEQTGTRRAESPEALRWTLRESGLRLIEAKEGSGHAKSRNVQSLWGGRVRSVDIELALRQMVVLLRSGMTLLTSLETIVEQGQSRGVRRCFARIRDRIEQGQSFAEALEQERAFPPTVVAMVALGEESGSLETVLDRSANGMENRRQLLNSTITALFYPAITVFFAIAIAIYMVVAVIPPMKRAIEALGRRLPPMTQSLVDISDFFMTHGLYIGIGLIALVAVLVALYLWGPSRLVMDRWLLRMPLIGHVFRTSNTALFCRSMNTLAASGIPLVDSLAVIRRILRNRFLEGIVESARTRVLGGGSLAESLTHPRGFMPLMHRLIAVGEASGNLEDTLEQGAVFHEQQLTVLIKKLSAFIEPAIILVVGFIVGYVYIAFFLGLYGTVS